MTFLPQTDKMSPAMSDKMNFKIFYGWWIVLVGFLCAVIWSGCGTYAFSLFVKPLQTNFGWNRAAIMFAFTIMLATVALGSPFIGKATDRYGPKRVILVGATMTGLGFVLLNAMNTLWHFYADYVFIGIGIAAMGQVPLTTVVSNWFKKKRGLAIGIMASGIGVGGLALAPLVGGYIIPSFGWRTAYLALAFMTWGIVIPLVLAVIKTRPQDEGLLPDGEVFQDAGDTASSSIPSSNGLSLNSAVLTPAFWLISGSFLLSQFSVMGALQNQVPHLQDAGFDVGTAAAALGGIGFTSAISKITFGWLCDRIEAKYACAIGIILQAGGTFILMRIQPNSPPMVLWLYVIVFGLGAGHWLPVVSMIVSRTFGLASYGAIFGGVTLFLNMGVSVGPLAAGYIYDRTNTYFWAFVIFLGLYLIAIGAILSVRRPKTKWDVEDHYGRSRP